ncbi:MAG: FAD-dependent oxidoreductase [Chloroflexota bacterium]|nr:FAD-dependent oxidoreductase [Chloroflexota bacterium]
MTSDRVDVLVVGGGPAGLAAAIELRRRGLGRIVVAEREREPGGIPRHSDHQGYGLIDLHRPLTGPEYARRYAHAAAGAGVEIRTETSVTGWVDERVASTTSSAGLIDIEARAVVLATGCRERPRSARLVPGTRPAGIFTTGALQQAVHIGLAIGDSAVVVGAEHVSFSALMTLHHAGVRPVAMVTEHPHHQTYAPLALATARRYHTPVLTGQRLTRILGRERVEGVEITDVAAGTTRVLDCDTVVFTGDWIPDHELARMAGLAIDPGTKGPRVDGAFRTSSSGVFAVGNLLHGAETSDVVTGEGRDVGGAVTAWLKDGRWTSEPVIPIVAEAPIAWIAPNCVMPGPGTGLGDTRFRLRVSSSAESAKVDVTQDGRRLWRGRPVTGMVASFAPGLPDALLHGPLVPGRSAHLPGTWQTLVRAGGGPITVAIDET